jgi:hypothetical protein
MSRLLAFLRTRPQGVTPVVAARDGLGLSGPDSHLGTIALAALRALPGAMEGSDGLWRAAAPAPPAVLGIAALVTGPRPPRDLLLAIGAAAESPGGVSDVLSAVVRPSRTLPASVIPAHGSVPGTETLSLDEVLRRLAPRMDGARLVLFDDGDPAGFLLRAMEAAGQSVVVEETILLGPALREAGILPRNAGLPRAAETFGVPVPEGDDPGLRARATVEIFLRARDRLAADRTDDAGFGCREFGPEILDTLPPRPGVYSFYDREGRLVYVGKAADLRRRVRSWFGRSRKRRPHEEEILLRLYRLEWEETGSELAALLREAELIRTGRPALNVQCDTAERRPSAGDLALFLPAEDPARATVLFVRAGQPVARLELDRWRPDLRALRDAVRGTCCRPDLLVTGDVAESRILANWLSTHGDRQNLMDLSETRGMTDAVRRIRTWLADPDLFSDRVYRR